jgi:hypothetical protein
MSPPYRMQLAANGVPTGIRPDTPPRLDEQHYKEVQHLMLSDDHYSFATQIKDTFTKHGPEAYLVTAYSAIPIADSIRGFYEELGIDQPLVDYVLAPKGLSRFVIARAERLRLKNLLKEITGKVCVVDEYTVTGQTVARSRKSLIGAGISETDVVSIKGKWYHSALRHDLQVDQVTSVHRDYMNSIGRDACTLAFA